MGIRDRLRRLQRAAQGQLEYIQLEDGGRYWYDPKEAGTEIFMYGVNSLQADFEAAICSEVEPKRREHTGICPGSLLRREACTDARDGSITVQTAKGERRSSPPAILLAIARAKDRRGAVERLYSQGTLALTAYDPEALAERGEFVHRSFVVGKDYGEALEDLSE